MNGHKTSNIPYTHDPTDDYQHTGAVFSGVSVCVLDRDDHHGVTKAHRKKRAMRDNKKTTVSHVGQITIYCCRSSRS